MGVGPFAGRTSDVTAKWKEGIRALSALPNISVKLSGLTMCNTVVGTQLWRKDRPPTSEQLAEMMGPFYLYCIEQLGVERCMFASNFPVDRACCSYTVLFNALKKIVRDFSYDEKVALFCTNAQRIYGL